MANVQVDIMAKLLVEIGQTKQAQSEALDDMRQRLASSIEQVQTQVSDTCNEKTESLRMEVEAKLNWVDRRLEEVRSKSKIILCDSQAERALIRCIHGTCVCTGCCRPKSRDD
jgi:hypothetical protein